MRTEQMIKVYPSYYQQFHCLAGACRHTCCVGWEIDIDPRALRRYLKMPGALGERLRRNIDCEEFPPHFRMEEGERCPFLNGEGLCDIILEKGEGALCQICADHPRFYNQLEGYEQIGLGLCCEAACRLILSQKEPVRFSLLDDGRKKTPLRKGDEAILQYLDWLIHQAQDRSCCMAERIEAVMDGLYLPPYTPKQWADVFLSLERMDSAWTERLLRLREKKAFPALDEVMLEQLLVYFLYRHMVPCWKCGKPLLAPLFAVLSVKMIAWTSESDEDLYEAARLYSAEIEYSDENVPALLDVLAAAQEEETT